jgi:L-2-hydroxyglutarate oxidase LhgO
LAGQVTKAMMDDATQSGTVIFHDAPFLSAEPIATATSSSSTTTKTTSSYLLSAPWRVRAGSRGQHVLECAHFINAAGLYADRVAQQFGFAQDYTVPDVNPYQIIFFNSLS